MKRLITTGAAVASLALTGCTSNGITRSATAAPAPATSPTMTPSKSPEKTVVGQSFDYQDATGYRWRITVAVGQSGPTIHADNCAQGGFDASPGHTNVAVTLSITNLLKDRGEPVPTSLSLSAGDPNDTLIGPDDASGFSCDAQLSIGRWFKPGETVAMSGIIRNVPDPIPVHSVAVIRDGDGGKTVGPLVELDHG
ncbi:hypothetical protein [Streptomyces hokutonensis]|uniref:hypothetical protein n=1 Tax=Streptomyces hokutonensis TaxID=1306990 RepID=UPI0037F57707